MKKIKFSSCVLLLYTLVSFIAKADSWNIIESEFTYWNNSFSLNNPLPGSHPFQQAFRVPHGKTLLIVSNGRLPITINQAGEVLTEHDADFARLYYAPSKINSVAYDANGTCFFQNTHIVAYYDIETETWNGINVRSNRRIGSMPLLRIDNVFGMTFDKDNNLFLTGSKGGKPVFAILKNAAWDIIPIAEDLFFPVSQENRIIKDSEQNIVYHGFSDRFILTSPTLSADGSIWMKRGDSTADGLFRYANGMLDYIQSEPVTNLTADPYGNVIYSTKEEIGIIYAGTFAMSTLIKEASTAIFADKDAIWYSFPVINEGFSTWLKCTYLKRYDLATKKTKVYTSDISSFSGEIKNISGDKNGNMALVLNSALYLLNKTDFPKYNEKWMQYSSGYMDDMDFLKKDIIRLNKNGRYPTTVSCDALNNRFVGVYRNNNWIYYEMNVDEEAERRFGMKGTYPNCACYTSKGILIGTSNNGMMLFNPTTERAVNMSGYDLMKMGKDVRDIKEDKNGNIWIGTNKGLILYDGIRFLLFDKKKSAFKSNKVNCIHITPNNVVWVGTEGDGIFSFNGKAWTAFTKKEGLRGENVGNLSGIGETIYSSDLNEQRMSNKIFTIANGRVTQEELPFYIAANAIHPDEKGNLWIIGNKSGVICRRANGAAKIYNQNNSPVGYDGAGADAYRMSGYTFNGKLYIRSYYRPLIDYKHQERAIATKAPLEIMAGKYDGLTNTFDGNVISVMEIK